MLAECIFWRWRWPRRNRRNTSQKIAKGKWRPELTIPEEVKGQIRPSKVRKAPGYDKISNPVLRCFKRQVVVALTNIINAMSRLRYFPKKCKSSDVIMLPKYGKSSTLPQNYTPHQLVAALSKITESLLAESNNTEEFNFLPEEQLILGY